MVTEFRDSLRCGFSWVSEYNADWNKQSLLRFAPAELIPTGTAYIRCNLRNGTKPWIKQVAYKPQVTFPNTYCESDDSYHFRLRTNILSANIRWSSKSQLTRATNCPIVRATLCLPTNKKTNRSCERAHVCTTLCHATGCRPISWATTRSYELAFMTHSDSYDCF